MSNTIDTNTGNNIAITTETAGQREARERVLRAAAALLERDGRDALTTRAVAAAAGLQPPALYRMFAGKEGLLDALGAHGFAEYLQAKRSAPRHADPVQALRAGWDTHVGFGLEHPAFYLLVYGEPDVASTARRRADEMLRTLVERIAQAGRLRTSVRRGVEMTHAAGVGVVLTQLAVPEPERDPELSPMLREATLEAITTGAPTVVGELAPETAPASVSAATLAAVLGEQPSTADAAIGAAERALLLQWLDRLAES